MASASSSSPRAGSRPGIAGDVDQELRIGMPMELTVVPFTTDEDGTEVLTFAFRPVEES